MRDLAIIIPVWGDRYWLVVDRAIVALRRQGIPASDVFIIAPETERSREQADLVRTFPGIQVVQSPAFASIGALRNWALSHTESRWIMWADADDETSAGAIMALKTARCDHPDAVAVFGGNKRSDGTAYPWPSQWSLGIRSASLRRLLQWGWNNMPMTNGAMMRREALERLGGYPETNLAEDGAVACGLSALGPVIAVSLATNTYHVHAEGLCQRGHTAATWRKTWASQRRYLATRKALPLRWRCAAHLYWPIHTMLSFYLSSRAKFTQ